MPMTKDEAIILLATEGPSVVGTKLHPTNWPILEWAEIVAKASKINPALVKDITQRMGLLEKPIATSGSVTEFKTGAVELVQRTIKTEHIHAQNVHDYFFKHWKEHGWDDLCNFVCCRPPFEDVLITYDAFSYDADGKRLPDIHTGVSVTRVDSIRYAGSAEATGIKAIEDFKANTNPDLLIGIRTSLEGIEIPGILIVALDKLGRVVSDQRNGQVYIEIRTTKTNEHYQHILHRDSMIALATINFMNCKNVELVDNPPSRQQRRHAERTNQPPPVTYKTLMLHPFGKRSRALQRSEAPNPGNTALHIVRGHFKDYRAGIGLGRAHVKGVWWWAPQIRGTNPDRVVEKDYSVQTN